MIELRETDVNELAEIYELGQQAHTKPFLNTKTMAEIKHEFSGKNIIYLNIVNTSNTILGYFILKKDQNENSIQLKRILIGKSSLGIGQNALVKLEKYCVWTLKAEHIWLDVYDDNCRAIHVYEKFGFKVFNTEIQDNRTVLFYEKSL